MPKITGKNQNRGKVEINWKIFFGTGQASTLNFLTIFFSIKNALLVFQSMFTYCCRKEVRMDM